MKSQHLCQAIFLMCFFIHQGYCSRKVYVEADQSCGESHLLDAGDTFVIGQKRGPSKDLKAQCEITFTSASAEDEDRVCMEIEELQFQGNCDASLSIYDVVTGDGREKQLGAFDCHRTPPLEVCSIGKTLKMNLNRGYISFQRDLVLFLLQVYTKNPDAPIEDRIKEVPSVFHSVDTYIIILIVIAAVIVLVLITLVAVAIFCVRHKARRTRRGGNPVSTLTNTQTPHPLQAAVPRQDLKSARMNTQEYYPLQPIPQRHFIGQRFAPFSYQAYTDRRWPGEEDPGYPSSGMSQSAAGTQSTPVSSYYQTYSLHDHPQTCNCYTYPAESLQADNYPNDGYTSERYSGDTYERYSGEGYHSDSYLTERYPTQNYSLERYPPHGVLRGYTGYPGHAGVTHPLVPGLFYASNLGYRPGEEDADQSDVSEEDCKGRQLPNHREIIHDQLEKEKDESDNNPEYQEIGPPTFRHVTFM